MCDAVQYAHDRGVEHNDLKQDNILVKRDQLPQGREDPVPVQVEFGIANVVGNRGRSLPRAAPVSTSYRQMNEAHIRTCTRDPLLRFFYVALALYLRNVWVWLH